MIKSNNTGAIASFKPDSIVAMQIPAQSVDKAKKAIAAALRSEGINVSFIKADACCEKVGNTRNQLNMDFDETATYPAEEVLEASHPGRALAGLRHREGLTQREMAEQIGISQARLSELERNKRRVSIDMAKRIGEIFDVSYKSLL